MKHTLASQAFRDGVVDEIARTMQTLGQSPVAHPGESFYLERFEAYQQALSDLDSYILDRGHVKLKEHNDI